MAAYGSGQKVKLTLRDGWIGAEKLEVDGHEIYVSWVSIEASANDHTKVTLEMLVDNRDLEVTLGRPPDPVVQELPTEEADA